MLLTRITPPVDLPVTVAEAKDHCNITHDEQDALFEGLITGVMDYLDGPSGVLGRVIVEQVWRLDLSGWPRSPLTLPIEPVSAVTITYFDAAGIEQTLPEASFRLDATSGEPSVLHITADGALPALEPGRAYPVRVAMAAGATTEAVPAGLKVLVKMMVGHWYENREAVIVGTGAIETPLGISTLLARYRKKL